MKKMPKHWMLGIVLVLLGCEEIVANPWGDVKFPSRDLSESVGGYAAGCLAGAQAIGATGTGYQVMRLSRHRYFAHPELVSLLKDAAASVDANQWGTLLVGDLSQPKGGPMKSGHKSHQIGLDADVWFWLDHPVANQRKLTKEERDTIGAVSVLDSEQKAINREVWKEKHVKLLEVFSTRPEVARIFVHPVIKKEICRTEGDAEWLRKLRPWYGHHYHFHVRLRCPEDSELCVDQFDPAPGSGCGADLDRWFTDSFQRSMSVFAQKAESLPVLPERCKEILGDDFPSSPRQSP